MVNTRVAQVSNVSSAATMEQLRTLFGFLGKIEDIRLFPKEDSVLPVTVRICFVRFEDPTSVGMAQHLSNTVFLDKALTVIPFPDGVIPEESKALQMVAASAGGIVSMMGNGGSGLLPTPPQPILGHLTGQITGVSASGTGPMEQTFAALGVPQPPPLSNVDPTKVEEIRRTVYVGNLDSVTVTAEQLLNFFQKVGEVKYVRMAGDETQPTRFAFVEFTEQSSVAKCLTYNGVMFAGRPLKINHSNNAIVKPPGKTQEAIQKELAQTMKQVRDAQALIQAAIDPEIKAAADKHLSAEIKAIAAQTLSKVLLGETEKKKKSTSRSPTRKKSRSRSRRRSRSRSKDARRSRSRRSTSRTRRRTKSPRRKSSPRKRSRSRSRHHKSRSKSKDKRSRSREKRKRSRTPPRGYRTRRSKSRSREKKDDSSRSKRRSRSTSRHRSRSKSRSGSPRRSSKHRKDRKRDRSKDRDRKDKESRSSSRKKKEKESSEKPPEAGDEKEEKPEKADLKVKRDYDEEEKGFDSQEGGAAAAATEMGDNVKTEDMDMDSD